MNESPYVAALASIRKGETRTFGEIAVLALRPGGARAAGRVVSSYPADGSAAWQRAVTASGGLSIDPERSEAQLERLRKDGARPRQDETIAAWARRVRASFVGNWRNRRFAARTDPRVEGFDPRFVERFDGEASAQARGFLRLDEPPEGGSRRAARKPALGRARVKQPPAARRPAR